MKEKLKAKLKSYGFWVSLASAVMVFLNTLGLKVDIPYLSQVTTAFLSILVIAGILTKPGEQNAPEDEPQCGGGQAAEEAEETSAADAEQSATDEPENAATAADEPESAATATDNTETEAAAEEPDQAIAPNTK